MFGLFQTLKGRGGIASLICFALVLVGWGALHAFGPHINPIQDRAAVTAFFIVAGGFVGGVSLALLRLVLKAMSKR